MGNIIFTLLFFIFLFANSTMAQRERVSIKKTLGEIIIDGNITAGEWGTKPTISKFYRADDIKNPINSKTFVWILYDDNYLYIAAHMMDKDIIANCTKKDSFGLFSDDVFEIFIKPDFKSKYFYEIDVNPVGTIFDACLQFKHLYLHNAIEFSSGVLCATKISGTLNNMKDTDTGWDIEMRIPLSTFGILQPPKKGNAWYFAACRTDYSVFLPYGKEYSSSAKFRKLDFHSYYDYDIILFK
ncbi:MAG: carbohydrate-binding family 9-like protein [Candidatus Ratteibacteria bacterium]